MSSTSADVQNLYQALSDSAARMLYRLGAAISVGALLPSPEPAAKRVDGYVELRFGAVNSTTPAMPINNLCSFCYPQTSLKDSYFYKKLTKQRIRYTCESPECDVQKRN